MNRVAVQNANALIEEQLIKHSLELEGVLRSDVLTVMSPIAWGVDDLIRDAIEARRPKRRHISVVLETDGGYIEVAQRIADTVRHHYSRVTFIVPNRAMSAGTVLVMAGDEIKMDYYSVLGPIDPQVQRPGSRSWIPALGYLIQYERLMTKAASGTLNTAELAFLLEKFDPAELYRYEQSRQLSITLLKQWLVKYKFRNWKQTKTRRILVTRKMRQQRAEEIAHKLNSTDVWHTHARGISMQVLRRDLKLEIDDFGLNKNLDRQIKTYYRLLTDYMMRRNHHAVLHGKEGYVPIITGI